MGISKRICIFDCNKFNAVLIGEARNSCDA